jgi:hypothetical protein
MYRKKMHMAITIAILPIFKTTNSSHSCEFFLCQTYPFLSRPVLSYCHQIKQLQLEINSTFFTISAGSTKLAAGHDGILAQQQNGALFIL